MSEMTLSNDDHCVPVSSLIWWILGMGSLVREVKLLLVKVWLVFT